MSGERSLDIRCSFSVIAERGRKETRCRVVVSIKDTFMIAGTRRTSNVQATVNYRTLRHVKYSQLVGDLIQVPEGTTDLVSSLKSLGHDQSRHH